MAGDAGRGVTAAEAAEVGLLPQIADRDLPTRQAHVGELDGDAGRAPVSVEERDSTRVAATESLRPDLKPGLRTTTFGSTTGRISTSAPLANSNAAQAARRS